MKLNFRAIAFLFPVVLTALLSSAAAKADPAAAPPPSAPSWTGWFVGGGFGGVFSDSQKLLTSGNDPFTSVNIQLQRRPPVFSHQSNGVIGGVEFGYDRLLTPDSGILVGLSTRYNRSNLDRTVTVLGAPVYPETPPVLSAYRQSLDQLGTVTGRIGVLLDDSVLIYGSGGFAYGSVQYQGNFYNPLYNNALAYQGRFSGIETGYAVGAGVEYRLFSGKATPGSDLLSCDDCALTVKGEFLHYDLGSRDVVMTDGLIAASQGSYTTRFETRGQFFLLSLNYRFT
jgi:outer membrane immunogenic protein